MLVRDLMTINPICCTPETTLAEAAEVMEAHNCGALPVVTSQITRRVIGMVTDRDIACRCAGHGKDPLTTPVRECMSGDVVSVTEETETAEAYRLMSEYQVRRLPVVDELGRSKGILAQADVARKASPDEVFRVVRGVSRRPLPAGQVAAR